MEQTNHAIQVCIPGEKWLKVSVTLYLHNRFLTFLTFLYDLVYNHRSAFQHRLFLALLMFHI